MTLQVISSAGALKETTSFGNAGYGVALPSTPTDGMEYILVDSVTVPTYQWRFRYNNGSSNTDKWEFVGGAPKYSAVETAETINSTTYIDLTTVHSFTIPRAGQYLIEYGAVITVGAGASNFLSYGAPKIGAAATADADAIEWRNDTVTGAALSGSQARTKQFTCAASDAVKLQFRQSAASGFNAAKRWMSFEPIRVS